MPECARGKMSRQLHITNGDSTANTMIEAGIPGRVFPWRDILHDGPVPAGLGLEELAAVRARFLEQSGMANFKQILQGFRERDQTLMHFEQFDKVTLWLEHDLYDQLQLLQLLHWFSGVEPGQTALRLICIDHFPGVTPFYGLGQLDTRQMASLLGTEKAITPQQLELGRRGWLAFTADSPIPLTELIAEDLSALPFLKAALIRHLEEFPDSLTGLPRHERQILEMVEAGIHRPSRLFAEHQKREQAPYLGDWGFWGIIELLTNTPNALLETGTGQNFVHPPEVPADNAFRSQQLGLTRLGRSVLRGDADWVALNPPDRWKGSVHLHPDKTIWRWDVCRQTIVVPPS
jgi:Domain of unknown function (DUF1835)